MRWPSNEHSGVKTVSTSGSCPLAQGDQASVRSVKARISTVRKRNEDREADGEEEVVLWKLSLSLSAEAAVPKARLQQ